MSTFIKNLIALKEKKFITDAYILDLKERGKITEEEYNLVISVENPL